MIKVTLNYCGTADVRRILQNSFPFSGTTTPSEDDVVATIEDVQDEIDNQTRHAWREVRVVEEFYNFPIEYPGRFYYRDPGIPIHLRHRKIRTPGTANADKIEIWEGGSAYVDWVETKTNDRNNDYWIDEEQGILYIKLWYPFYREKAARLTYRYGDTTVPKDIRRAAAMMTAIELIENDINTGMLTDSGVPQLDYGTRLTRMQDKVDKILKNRTEILII